jgi:tartrate dehydrogenase/decarboxylase/D-malate dehydrogenase
VATHRIAVIPGDNVGPEVITEGLKCLEAVASVAGFAFTTTTFPWGAGYYREHGEAMPEDGLDRLRAFDAILLGAIGDPYRVPDKLVFARGVVQRVRRGFNQYVNLRPCRLVPGVPTPLRSEKEVDLVVVRENTEGEYAWMGGRHYEGTPDELATQVNIFTRRGIERVCRYAFALARQRNKKKLVTSVTKSNALHHTMTLWDDVFEDVARDYPDVQTNKVYVDAMAMYLITRPEAYDVIVTTNLFGDILSDEASAIQGSIGLAAGANLNPERTHPSMFEPIHGSAPDIAGKGIANPIGTIGAVQLMLAFLGEADAAALLERAIVDVLREGRARTPDLGGSASTAQVGDAVAQRVRELAQES